MEKIRLAAERIKHYKSMKIKPNFTKLEEETGVNRHILSDLYYEKRTLED